MNKISKEYQVLKKETKKQLKKVKALNESLVIMKNSGKVLDDTDIKLMEKMMNHQVEEGAELQHLTFDLALSHIDYAIFKCEKAFGVKINRNNKELEDFESKLANILNSLIYDEVNK